MLTRDKNDKRDLVFAVFKSRRSLMHGSYVVEFGESVIDGRIPEFRAVAIEIAAAAAAAASTRRGDAARGRGVAMGAAGGCYSVPVKFLLA